MRLTRFTDYALRVLILLGLSADRLTTVGEISARYDISSNHLTKVVQKLAQCGYVETVRGKGGGIRLTREPAEIRLGDVVRDLEEDMTVVECFDQARNTCAIEQDCRLQSVLRDSLNAFLSELDRHTLADLTKPRRKLRFLLDMNN